MNRIERPYAINEELRRAGDAGTTAAGLAEHLEVSTRTIKRYISALQQAGSPIWSRTGPGGGYVLSGRASLPPVNFSTSQAVAVATTLTTMADGSQFGMDAKAALNKLVDALGPAEANQAAAVARRIWILPSHPDRTRAGSRVLRSVERSLMERRRLAITYHAVNGSITRRTVEPPSSPRCADTGTSSPTATRRPPFAGSGSTGSNGPTSPSSTTSYWT